MSIIPKISIIIPVYNRENLLHYTLDSIINQSFLDWECILVDDYSTDASYEIMELYKKKDTRFKVYKKPKELKKGANTARNFGFTKSIGSVIKWFDSDDIMLPKHLETAYQVLIENSLDFVFTDSINFDNDSQLLLDRPYQFDRNNVIITAENLAYVKIGWITDDFLGLRKIVDCVKFNENIKDGDEYNFFIKILLNEGKGTFINKTLTHRRIHVDSITCRNRNNDINYMTIVASLNFHTAKDLVIYNNRKLIRWFLSGYAVYAFQLASKKKNIPFKKEAFRLICHYFSIFKGMTFLIALLIGFCFNKGYNLMKFART